MRSLRAVDAVHAGEDIADDDLKRMADAAERIDAQRRQREEETAAAVVWLKAKRDELGLVALAKTLGVDAANLGKVTAGKRKPGRMLRSAAAYQKLNG
jgi:hypothetical protein